MRKITTVILLCLVMAFHAYPAEWQWSVTIPSVVSGETSAHPEAFLWIPYDCREVKAVVWITPVLDFPWDVGTGCNDALLGALDDLADVSGYGELAHVPIVPVGHSAMATFPWNFAAWNPDRTLAVISYHGDAPRTNLTGYGGANIEWGRTRNIDGIPGLMVEGEYEWWEARVNPALAFRMMYPESCISFLCDAGRGHFDVSDRTADYIGIFIQKALEYRMPDAGVSGMIRLDPEDGWLAERWRTGTPGPQGEVRTARLARLPRRAQPAPYPKYRGDRHDAFWYFDEEMAMMTEDIYRQEHDMRPQYLGFVQDGRLAAYDSSAHVTFLSVKFLSE